jgi:hypothetical protein
VNLITYALFAIPGDTSSITDLNPSEPSAIATNDVNAITPRNRIIVAIIDLMI